MQRVDGETVLDAFAASPTPSRSRAPAAPLLILAAAAALLTGCQQTSTISRGCNADEDCGNPQFFVCDLETAECRCRSNDACAAGETCNAEGYCQAKVGCHQSADCPTDFFCDLGSSTCLPVGRCATDLHCKQGELCDPASNTCKAGCRTHGDCRLYETCLCTTLAEDGSEIVGPCGCDSTDPAERAKCAIGQCSSQTCGDDDFCQYGERCVPPEEGELPQCASDYDPVHRPYCDSCVYSPGRDTCGKGPNFCLTDTYRRSTFCGVDCSDGKSCAKGYQCRDVVVVYSRWECVSDSDCNTPDSRSRTPCREDSDCPNSGVCGKDPGQDEGFCHGKCFVREGATRGFCSCVVDDDCYQDSCDTATRTCSVTKRECTLNGEGCRPIRCVDMGDRGGCHIGENCAPIEGLHCGDLR